MTGILRALGALLFNHTDSSLGREKRGSESSSPRSSECTVLTIDDDPALIHILRTVLREEGFNVLSSTSGSKGLDMLRYAPRDIRVVLLDYNMPQLNGAETLRFLRKLSPNVRVIALTGVDINLLPESFRNGVDKFILKPFQPHDLIDAIRSVIGSSAPAQTTGNS